MQSFVVANGLSISQGGSYQIVASIDPQTTATTAPILVAARPTVDAPPVLYDGQSMLGGRGRHRHLVGFELDFSAAMDPTAAANPANYSVVQFRRRGRRRHIHHRAEGVGHHPLADACVATVDCAAFDGDHPSEDRP